MNLKNVSHAVSKAKTVQWLFICSAIAARCYTLTASSWRF